MLAIDRLRKVETASCPTRILLTTYMHCSTSPRSSPAVIACLHQHCKYVTSLLKDGQIFTVDGDMGSIVGSGIITMLLDATRVGNFKLIFLIAALVAMGDLIVGLGIRNRMPENV